jgi:hypothetical protein
MSCMLPYWKCCLLLTNNILHQKLQATEPYLLNIPYVILSSWVFMIHRVQSLHKCIYIPFFIFFHYVWVVTCGIVCYVWLFSEESAWLVAMLYIALASTETSPILILHFHLCLCLLIIIFQNICFPELSVQEWVNGAVYSLIMKGFQFQFYWCKWDKKN